MEKPIFSRLNHASSWTFLTNHCSHGIQNSKELKHILEPFLKLTEPKFLSRIPVILLSITSCKFPYWPTGTSFIFCAKTRPYLFSVTHYWFFKDSRQSSSRNRNFFLPQSYFLSLTYRYFKNLHFIKMGYAYSTSLFFRCNRRSHHHR